MRASILAAAERLLAVFLFVSTLPLFLVISLLLCANSKEPVLLNEESERASGAKVRTYRFRTTGAGTDTFRIVGRLLRKYSFDKLPGFLTVARGEARLTDVFPISPRRRM
jgi:lipopolysaccharide/colanic/teichoic acid biosynthesis glycosyltransferase